MNALPARHAHWHPASLASAAFVLLCCVGSGLATLYAAPETTTVSWRTDSLRPADSWNTLSLDMNVSRRHITKSGVVTGTPSPSASYRVERSSRSGSWKTVITVLGVQLPPRYSFSGALIPPARLPVGRIEDDEDGTPVRVYDRNGQLMKSTLVSSAGNPSAAFAPPRSNGREWLESFVATTAKRTWRQQNFERQFGKASRAGTLSRFLRRDPDSSQEVLVDPRTVVPVEANAVSGGRLIAHRTFTYAAAPDSAVVRIGVHAGILVSTDTGERAVVDTAFSNIRLQQRR